MSLYSQFVATVYDRLFTDPELLSTDVKVYGVLWNRPGHSMRATARESGMPYETFRSAARRLVATGWAYEVRLANGTAVIPWMPLEVEESFVTLLSRMRDGIQYRGEWLMRCLLDLLLRRPDYIDNARPEWLVTGDGSGRLELDRWYWSANLAFEFQGPQHYRLGTPYTATADQLLERQRLDSIKAELCEAEGIQLISVYASDLSLERMEAKLCGTAPVVPLPAGSALVRFFERQCRAYRNYVARIERDGTVPE